MKVTAFVGSARKKHTYFATEYFLKCLQSLGNVEYEIIPLSEFKLGICKGCKLCIDKGEELCPMKDDRDELIEKMYSSDGIILASPNYSFDMSGLMKVFLDRLGFAFHRPQFFGKAFTSIVVQGVYRGNIIVRYFNFIGKNLGFNVVKGLCLNSLEPMTEKEHKNINKILDKHAEKYYSVLTKKEYPIPTFFELMIFRMARTSIQLLLNDSWKDYTFYKQNGWFESNYYYKTHLNSLKKIIGKLFDWIFARIYAKKIAFQQIQPV
jgi:multimeric flavodoxin WrbA